MKNVEWEIFNTNPLDDPQREKNFAITLDKNDPPYLSNYKISNSSISLHL